MRCGWGPYVRRTFEVQAGNSPLQGQSKPPAKLVVLIVCRYVAVILIYIRYFLWWRMLGIYSVQGSVLASRNRQRPGFCASVR